MKLELYKPLISHDEIELDSVEAQLREALRVVQKELDRRVGKKMVAVWGFQEYNPETKRYEWLGYETREKATDKILERAKNPGEEETFPYQIVKWYADGASIRTKTDRDDDLPDDRIDPR